MELRSRLMAHWNLLRAGVIDFVGVQDDGSGRSIRRLSLKNEEDCHDKLAVIVKIMCASNSHVDGIAMSDC